jgi:hypothetical protein
MVDKQRHNGTRKNRTNLSYFPKSCNRSIEAAEDQNGKHDYVYQVHDHVFGPLGLDGHRGQVRSFEGHENKPATACLSDDHVIWTLPLMMARFQVTQNETDLCSE